MEVINVGRVTDENRRALEKSLFFEDADLKGMIDNEFPATLGRLIKQKRISVLTIVENTNVSKSYINKLRNTSEKHVNPSRRVVIDIALAINATLDETNSLLKAARYQELYTRDPAEALIIWGMLNKKSGTEIRRLLQEKGLDDMFKDK